LKVNDRHCIGETIECLLGCTLNPNQLGLIGTAKFPKACRHCIERFGKVSDLIAGFALHDEIKIPLPDLTC
jgi:hypothetical protein